jgi:hypothetical protein
VNHYFIPNPAVEFFNTIAPNLPFAAMKPKWPFGWKLSFDRPATALDRANLVGQRARDNFGLNCSAPDRCLAILAAGGAERGGSTD